jgi:putative transposase
MSQSLCRNFIHLIFSTKERRPLLTDDIRDEMHGYLRGVLRNWDSPSIIIGGVEDHVHILFLVSKNHALAEIVEEVKSGSSKWIKTKSTKLINFYWQNGYGEFSVSQSNVKSVRQYIQKQKEHHDNVSYQDEFRNFVKRHDVNYEERYVWD